MTKRLTITIPDELAAEIEALKNRENLSKICRSALQKEIEKYKRIASTIGDKKAIIQRLRDERDQLLRNYYDEGYKSGLEDAENLEYSDFIFLERGLGKINEDTFFDKFGAILDEYYRNYEEADPDFQRGSFVSGWVDGVNSFFKAVKEEL